MISVKFLFNLGFVCVVGILSACEFIPDKSSEPDSSSARSGPEKDKDKSGSVWFSLEIPTGRLKDLTWEPKRDKYFQDIKIIKTESKTEQPKHRKNHKSMAYERLHMKLDSVREGDFIVRFYIDGRSYKKVSFKISQLNMDSNPLEDLKSTIHVEDFLDPGEEPSAIGSESQGKPDGSREENLSNPSLVVDDPSVQAPMPQIPDSQSQIIPAPIPDGSLVMPAPIPAPIPDGSLVMPAPIPAPIPDGSTVVAAPIPGAPALPESIHLPPAIPLPPAINLPAPGRSGRTTRVSVSTLIVNALEEDTRVSEHDMQGIVSRYAQSPDRSGSGASEPASQGMMGRSGGILRSESAQSRDSVFDLKCGLFRQDQPGIEYQGDLPLGSMNGSARTFAKASFMKDLAGTPVPGAAATICDRFYQVVSAFDSELSIENFEKQLFQAFFLAKDDDSSQAHLYRYLSKISELLKLNDFDPAMVEPFLSRLYSTDHLRDQANDVETTVYRSRVSRLAEMSFLNSLGEVEKLRGAFDSILLQYDTYVKDVRTVKKYWNPVRGDFKAYLYTVADLCNRVAQGLRLGARCARRSSGGSVTIAIGGFKSLDRQRPGILNDIFFHLPEGRRPDHEFWAYHYTELASSGALTSLLRSQAEGDFPFSSSRLSATSDLYQRMCELKRSLSVDLDCRPDVNITNLDRIFTSTDKLWLGYAREFWAEYNRFLTGTREQIPFTWYARGLNAGSFERLSLAYLCDEEEASCSEVTIAYGRDEGRIWHIPVDKIHSPFAIEEPKFKQELVEAYRLVDAPITPLQAVSLTEL